MQSKISWIAVCALVVCAAAVAALGPSLADDTGEDRAAGDTLVVVNGQSINKEQLYAKLIERYGAEVLGEMVYRTILQQEVDKHHVTSSPRERERIVDIRVERRIEAERQQVEKQYGGKINFETYLKHTKGVDVEKYRELIRKQMLEGEANIEELIDTDVKMEKLARYYAMTHDSARVAHILVKEKTAALEIIDRIKGGDNFFQLAGKLSEDRYTKGNQGILALPVYQGDWRFRPDVPGPEFENTAFALIRPGELCEEPVKSARGWHVIKLLDRAQGEAKTFTELEQKIMKSIRSNPMSYEESNAYMMRLLAESKVENKSDIKLNLPQFASPEEEPEE